MKWKKGRRSDNVEDRRGQKVSPGMAVGGGGLGFLVLALLVAVLGGDPTVLLQQATAPAPAGSSQPTANPGDGNDELADFVSVVLADTEDTWEELFQAGGGTYQEPNLVLFSDQVDSACGAAESAMGPFYCPADQKVYIDLSFYEDLRTRYQAPGDFAQAYVIAHEVGHHVQNLLGVSGQVHQLKQQVSEVEANQLSVRLELQADCFAGIWAHHADKARDILEAGDVEEALNAASAIGDDRLQQEARGRVAPDSFTHGSSAQRVRWFQQGMQTGSIDQCNTFAVDNP